MLYDVINYNDVTSTICSHEYAIKVPFTYIQGVFYIEAQNFSLFAVFA